jgi:hypothetical protein
MTVLFLLFLLSYVGLAVVLAIVASLMHSSFYDQMLEGTSWRAAAVAACIVGFLGLWAFIEHNSPSRFDSLFRYSSAKDIQFEQFWSERKTEVGTTETLFRRRILPGGRVEFADANGRAWRRSGSGVVTAIIVEEDGQRKRFVAQLGPDDTFLRDPSNPNNALEVQYIEEDGARRTMTENNIGTLPNPRYGALFVNTLFNLGFLVVWIVVVGIAFELGWGHAVVIGIIGWVATLLLIWPPIQSEVAALPKNTAIDAVARCQELVVMV